MKELILIITLLSLCVQRQSAQLEIWSSEIFDYEFLQYNSASFDQDNQLIYGVEENGTGYEVHHTFQYINNEPVEIRREAKKYLDINVTVDTKEVDTYRDTIWERSPDTGDMEQIQDDFIFYWKDRTDENEEAMRISVDSNTGRTVYDVWKGNYPEIME